MCLFSPHNLISDPPFSRLDLVSCRNLLIYLDAELQQRLIPLFHYALRRGGFLFLGPVGERRRHGRAVPHRRQEARDLPPSSARDGLKGPAEASRSPTRAEPIQSWGRTEQAAARTGRPARPGGRARWPRPMARPTWSSTIATRSSVLEGHSAGIFELGGGVAEPHPAGAWRARDLRRRSPRQQVRTPAGESTRDRGQARDRMAGLSQPRRQAATTWRSHLFQGRPGAGGPWRARRGSSDAAARRRLQTEASSLASWKGEQPVGADSSSVVTEASLRSRPRNGRARDPPATRSSPPLEPSEDAALVRKRK